MSNSENSYICLVYNLHGAIAKSREIGYPVCLTSKRAKSYKEDDEVATFIITSKKNLEKHFADALKRSDCKTVGIKKFKKNFDRKEAMALMNKAFK